RGLARKLIDNSFLLIAGAVSALIWANVHTSSYQSFINFDFFSLFPYASSSGHEIAAEAHSHGFTLHFFVNDIVMALFFAIAAKEVWESLLPGGSLANPKKAATPLLATVGGILGPAIVYIAGTYFTGT